MVGADEGAPVEDLGGCEGKVRKGWHGGSLWGFGIALRVWRVESG